MTEGSSNSLINLGDLSKPADTLIKKISGAVGGIFAPYQIKRIAHAQAEAAIIRTETDIEITDLHRRAAHRFIEEEAQRQKNIEDITAKALPQLTESARPDSMENDWVTNFFDKSRIVSDNEMQGLWSRILAGEANAPGTYSKRTVNFISDLDKTDAESFSKLCSFNWVIDKLTPLIFDDQAMIYRENGVNFASLVHLDSIGLIKFEPLAGFDIETKPGKYLINYFDKPLRLELTEKPITKLQIGKVMITKIGLELAPICNSKPIETFFEYTRDQWKKYLPKV